MRLLFDSVTAADVPAGSELVGGYVDGRFKWTDADWALHAGKVQVRIATQATTNDGNVLDVETGDATPAEAPSWVRLRRAAGVDPSIYTDRNEWPDVRAAFVNANEPEPHYWIAQWDNDPALLDGAVAKQYANSGLTGSNYDASSVADFWPGVDTVDQFVTKAEFEAYKVALQQQLDANYAAKQHPHTATASSTTVTLLPPTVTVT